MTLNNVERERDGMRINIETISPEHNLLIFVNIEHHSILLPGLVVTFIRRSQQYIIARIIIFFLRYNVSNKFESLLLVRPLRMV
jgi:hypothetical protein